MRLRGLSRAQEQQTQTLSYPCSLNTRAISLKPLQTSRIFPAIPLAGAMAPKTAEKAASKAIKPAKKGGKKGKKSVESWKIYIYKVCLSARLSRIHSFYNPRVPGALRGWQLLQAGCAPVANCATAVHAARLGIKLCEFVVPLRAAEIWQRQGSLSAAALWHRC